MRTENKLKISGGIFLAWMAVVILAFYFSAESAHAQPFTYTPMERIPGFEAETSGADLVGWITSIYKLAMWIVGICALFMITIGGFTYMTSAGNTSTAGSGKKIITDAIIGLILALVAVLLFTVINPNLTTVNLQITPATTSTAPAAPGGTVAPGAPAPTAVTSGSISGAITSLRANTNVKIDGAGTGDCKDASGNEITPDYSLNQAQNGNGSVTACNSSCKSGTNPCAKNVSMSLKLVDSINTVGKNNSMRVSSLTGGQHTSDGSAHYSGIAADVVPSASKPEWQAIAEQFKRAGCSSNQTYCDAGKGLSSCDVATHIHVQC